MYYLTLKFQVLDVISKGIPVFFKETRINPVSPFTKDGKCITLASGEEDKMISHDLYNFVSNILEEECSITVILIKI